MAEQNSEFEERVVCINRVAKVVKGGRRFSFSALVVIGNGTGAVGVGLGKANAVPEANGNASRQARKNILQVAVSGGSIPHEVLGEFAARVVLLKPDNEATS